MQKLALVEGESRLRSLVADCVNVFAQIVEVSLEGTLGHVLVRLADRDQHACLVFRGAGKVDHAVGCVLLRRVQQVARARVLQHVRLVAAPRAQLNAQVPLFLRRAPCADDRCGHALLVPCRRLKVPLHDAVQGVLALRCAGRDGSHFEQVGRVLHDGFVQRQVHAPRAGQESRDKLHDLRIRLVGHAPVRREVGLQNLAHERCRLRHQRQDLLDLLRLLDVPHDGAQLPFNLPTHHVDGQNFRMVEVGEAASVVPGHVCRTPTLLAQRHELLDRRLRQLVVNVHCMCVCVCGTDGGSRAEAMKYRYCS
eukprot:Rhum_TRINITY_DN15116_c23_g1::Rhum_TRINITY_DN15116_c23_g1_i1::g.139103::m.139103